MKEICLSSFRDPDGYVFKEDGLFKRQICESYIETYEKIKMSGLYEKLFEKDLLIPHTEVSTHNEIVLEPEQLDFLSYPYEWSFAQYKEAALCTLKILETAMDYGFILKDATAYNLTWHKGKMVFFDTLSFTPYEQGQPWMGYRQFCSHFLAPLALMSNVDLRMNGLMSKFIDGVPLDLASKLLPMKTKLNPALLLHIHLHANLQSKNADVRKKVDVKISTQTIKNLILSLKETIKNLQPFGAKTEWGDYYNDTNYSKDQSDEKAEIIKRWLANGNFKKILDLGSNDGTFSRIAKQHCEFVFSADIDPIAVDKNVWRCKKMKEKNITPILLDITAPSPAIGWGLAEREGIFERLKTDAAMALALVHHLAIGNNLPLESVFEVFKKIAPVWIVEFVDKEDSQVKRLLANREDVFPNYTIDGFRAAASKHFEIKEERMISGTKRTMFLLEMKG